MIFEMGHWKMITSWLFARFLIFDENFFFFFILSKRLMILVIHIKYRFLFLFLLFLIDFVAGKFLIIIIFLWFDWIYPQNNSRKNWFIHIWYGRHKHNWSFLIMKKKFFRFVQNSIQNRYREMAKNESLFMVWSKLDPNFIFW